MDPDGVFQGVDPFIVHCDMSRTIPAMIISHDSEAKGHVTGFEADGSFVVNIKYTGATIQQLAAMVKMSGNCRQYYRWDCHNTGLKYAWWVNRNGEKRQYWGGKNPGSTDVCECGLTQTCDSDEANIRMCNCNLNDNVWRKDEGYWTDADDLPVTQLCFGDTGSSVEQGYYTLGKLFCL